MTNGTGNSGITLYEVPILSHTHQVNSKNQQVWIRCGRVVTDFDWEAKNRFNS